MTNRLKFEGGNFTTQKSKAVINCTYQRRVQQLAPASLNELTLAGSPALQGQRNATRHTGILWENQQRELKAIYTTVTFAPSSEMKY